MQALERRLETAVALATEAGAMAMRLRPAPGGPQATLKGVQDWVTEADGAVERFLSERLLTAFPEDGFQGEEEGVGRTGALRWVVDPIDGTANYMRGANRFCVSIGLLEDRTPPGRRHRGARAGGDLRGASGRGGYPQWSGNQGGRHRGHAPSDN